MLFNNLERFTHDEKIGVSERLFSRNSLCFFICIFSIFNFTDMDSSMMAKQDINSLKILSYYIGNITVGFSGLLLLPLLTSLLFQEWSAAIDFTITFSISLILGILATLLGIDVKKNGLKVSWRHGLVVASLSWIILTIISSIPYVLSGHMLSFFDAMFDVMSGFTTTGVFLLQDLDHISQGLNFWRHLITFVGGQGMVVLALSFLVNEMGGAYKFYVGEGKDISLVPNVKGTTQLIWKISLVYLIIGTFILWITGIMIGLNPISSFFHGLYIFEAAWSTGGFAPNVQNIMYYHSFTYEVIGLIIFIIGSFNFGLHYALIQGKYSEFKKNIEIISFIITSLLGSLIAVYALSKSQVYVDGISLFRRVIYLVLSAHTTTGYGTIYAKQFAIEWGNLGIIIMTLVMLIGGSACSTAGGFKGIRVAVIFKSIIYDIKHMIFSEHRIHTEKYHHIKDYVINDKLFRSSAIIVLLYIVMFTIGLIISTSYGYTLTESAFEMASITGNVGLSIGVIQANMPFLMKFYYMIAMFLGRLEFLSIFALIGVLFQGGKKWLVKLVKS